MRILCLKPSPLLFQYKSSIPLSLSTFSSGDVCDTHRISVWLSGCLKNILMRIPSVYHQYTIHLTSTPTSDKNDANLSKCCYKVKVECMSGKVIKLDLEFNNVKPKTENEKELASKKV